MAEENGSTDLEKSDPQNERVGDILRKERIARRIALETIAKDLRLNVKYVRSLEANDYDDLPADPYIRVYLRSLAKYLLLDSEAILKKFYEERGIHDEKFRKGSDTQIPITMVEKENKKELKPWMIILIVIVALASISFLARKMSPSGSTTAPARPAAASTADTTHPAIAAGPAATDSNEDSLIGKLARHDSITGADTSKPAVAAIDTLVQTNGTLSLEIKAVKDSVWVQVFSDGVSWKNWLRPYQTKRCFARDSFNIHVGNNRLLEYTFNGRPFRIEAQEVAIFKLGRGMKLPEIWNLEKWNSVFKGRT